MSDDLIFKLVDREDWDATTTGGVYPGSAVDHQDGFIHMSSADQLADTARKHYRGRSDLFLVTIRVEALSDKLVWEPSRGGALFPHLYEPLPLTAVREIKTCHVDAAGQLHLDGGQS